MGLVPPYHIGVFLDHELGREMAMYARDIHDSERS